MKSKSKDIRTVEQRKNCGSFFESYAGVIIISNVMEIRRVDNHGSLMSFSHGQSCQQDYSCSGPFFFEQ